MKKMKEKWAPDPPPKKSVVAAVLDFFKNRICKREIYKH